MPAILTAPTTDQQLTAEVRALGLTIRKIDGEYRITYPLTTGHADPTARAQAKAAQENSAYYTNDRADAYNTAITMSRTQAGADLRAIRDAAQARIDAAAAQAPATVLQFGDALFQQWQRQQYDTAAAAMLARDPAEILRRAADHLYHRSGPASIVTHYRLRQIARAIDAHAEADQLLAATQASLRHDRM